MLKDLFEGMKVYSIGTEDELKSYLSKTKNYIGGILEGGVFTQYALAAISTLLLHEHYGESGLYIGGLLFIDGALRLAWPSKEKDDLKGVGLVGIIRESFTINNHQNSNPIHKTN